MTDSPLRVLVHGASGRMGGALLRLASAAPDLQLVAAVSPDGIVGDAVALRATDLASAPPFDVAIDFSLPAAFSPLLALCQARGSALVSGTTGLDETQRLALREAAAQIPVLWASNFSLGVVVLEDLVERAARVLSQWPIRIIETHHVHKLDAPSGTALSLAGAVERGSAQPASIQSLREGEVVGEHRVEFSGVGETLLLEHRAASRDIFAAGALEAARLLRGQGAGMHRLSDLVFRASA